jgi:hypothetical protein
LLMIVSWPRLLLGIGKPRGERRTEERALETQAQWSAPGNPGGGKNWLSSILRANLRGPSAIFAPQPFLERLRRLLQPHRRSPHSPFSASCCHNMYRAFRSAAELENTQLRHKQNCETMNHRCS